MQPLINIDFFNGDINIPNTNQLPIKEDLTKLIQKCQEEYLEGVLGIQLYKSLGSGWIADPVDQIWKDVVNGKDYDYYGETYRYRGLITAGNSPIAFYTFFMYMKKNASFLTGTGEAVSKKENAVSFTPTVKMVGAWNKMVRINVELRHFLIRNANIYADFRTYRQDINFFKTINQFGI